MWWILISLRMLSRGFPILNKGKCRARKKIRFLAKGGISGSYSMPQSLVTSICIRKSIDLNRTEQELELIDAMVPSIAMQALPEFQARSMVMSQRVANLLQKKLANKGKKKVVEELAILKKKVDADQAE